MRGTGVHVNTTALFCLRWQSCEPQWQYVFTLSICLCVRACDVVRPYVESFVLRPLLGDRGTSQNKHQSVSRVAE